MSKTYVLDTNVLLDNPSVIHSFAMGDIVVIPYAVLEELEKHKHSSHGDLSTKARICSRSLLKIFESCGEKKASEGIGLDNGSIVKLVSNVESPDWTSETGDDKILSVAVATNKQSETVLVTEDVILKLRAVANGLEVKSGNDAISSDNTENLPTSLDNLYSGARRIKVSDNVLSEYWQKIEPPKELNEEGDLVSGKLPSFFEISEEDQKEFDKHDLLPNEFVILEHEHSENSSKRPWAVLRKVHGQKHLKFVREKPLDKIKPLNVEQHLAADLLLDPKINLVTLMGQAGTGKTILALEAGLMQVMGNHSKYNSIIVLRPVHPVGKDIGFLPGSFEEKMSPWVAPIKDNLRVLLSSDGKGRSKQVEKTLEMLFEKGTIEIEALTYIRGRSIDNAFIVVDEGQNLNRHELKTILTRVGKGTKVVITGDIEQTDRSDVNAFNNGLSVAIEKFKPYSIVGHITLKEGVRSELSELAAKIL
jgi:PhoH-like ATPase